MAQNKYKNHVALRDKLKRLATAFPILKTGYSSLASALLDAFLEHDGLIPARVYYDSVFQIKGKNYTQWIDELKKIGIIEHVAVANPQKTDWIRYTPGPMTREYINREKLAQKEIATKDEVPSKTEFNNLKQELTDTKNRVTTIEESMKKVYSKLKLGEPDPPGYGKLQHHLTKDETN